METTKEELAQVKDRALTSREKRTFQSDISKLVWDTKFGEDRIALIQKTLQELAYLSMSPAALKASKECPNALIKHTFSMYPAPTRGYLQIILGDADIKHLSYELNKYVAEARVIQSNLVTLGSEILHTMRLHELMIKFPQFKKFWPQNKPVLKEVEKTQPAPKRVVPSQTADAVYSLLG